MALQLAGGEWPEDVERLKEDGGLRRLWAVLEKGPGHQPRGSRGRWRWLNRAGRVVSHGGRYILILSHLALEALLGLRAALARLAPG